MIIIPQVVLAVKSWIACGGSRDIWRQV